ncbi:uncharacterized protein KY384_006284 [Bacidia gigantensis]|uniref:uncharacterized protein n=1 Tax=Bacidia gigantensis TaxID=2732470 RepID=UPI001D03E664|nr:uncharacterized protein KY384_006284 [Bacidia gigantensis]KAG8528597.1 hypothetical protein KY384_006284 [Bacidia gigantensis]
MMYALKVLFHNNVAKEFKKGLQLEFIGNNRGAAEYLANVTNGESLLGRQPSTSSQVSDQAPKRPRIAIALAYLTTGELREVSVNPPKVPGEDS